MGPRRLRRGNVPAGNPLFISGLRGCFRAVLKTMPKTRRRVKRKGLFREKKDRFSKGSERLP